jgi:hypothetical protein
MALLRLAIAAFLLTNVVASVRAQPPSIEEDKWNGNLRRVLQYVWPALIADGGAASIYYTTVCGDVKNPLPFPKVEVQPPSKDNVGLTAIREIFSKDKNVRVSQDKSGMIRIAIAQGEHTVPQTTVGKPQYALLQTRIHSIKLDPGERYTPSLAVLKITASKEFESAMHELNLGRPQTLFSIGVNQPEKGVPHLPPAIRDMTLGEALDTVLKTFGGIILYPTCEEGEVDFEHVGTGDFDETMKRPAGRKKYGTPVRTGQ